MISDFILTPHSIPHQFPNFFFYFSLSCLTFSCSLASGLSILKENGLFLIHLKSQNFDVNFNYFRTINSRPTDEFPVCSWSFSFLSTEAKPLRISLIEADNYFSLLEDFLTSQVSPGGPSTIEDAIAASSTPSHLDFSCSVTLNQNRSWKCRHVVQH